MSLEDSILEAVRALPEDKQREVLELAVRLRAHGAEPHKQGRDYRGIWSDLNINVTQEDIDEARREMWKNFPRDVE